jgi:hypothetical protein
MDLVSISREFWRETWTTQISPVSGYFSPRPSLLRATNVHFKPPLLPSGNILYMYKKNAH